MNKTLKKVATVFMALALVGVMAIPAAASAKDLSESIRAFKKDIEDNIFKNFGRTVASMMQFGDTNGTISVGANLFFNNSSFKTARDNYNRAINQANSAYNSARASAYSTFSNALNSSNDQASRISAFRNYLSSLLSAMRTRDTARQTALQVFIDAVANVQTNTAPTAYNQSVSLAKNASVAITLTGVDPQSSALIFTVLSNPLHGLLSGTVPNLTYTPVANYTGTDSFTFKVNDGTYDSNTATVSITVNP